MRLIKLHTTESTNSFLKDLAKNSFLKNFTVVVANQQKKGRGQLGNYWSSEPFKNLTFSVFVEFSNLLIEQQKYLNFAVSLAVFEALNELKTPKLTIKWPNDILSENKKLCGILIESQIKKNKINSSIIGIGLNVNQTNFNHLQNATSLKNVLNKTIDLDNLLKRIIDKLKGKVNLLSDKKLKELEKDYFKNLYRFLKPSMFKDKNDVLFMAKIIGISLDGKLQLELENESIKEFGLKEIKFV